MNITCLLVTWKCVVLLYFVSSSSLAEQNQSLAFFSLHSVSVAWIVWELEKIFVIFVLMQEEIFITRFFHSAHRISRSKSKLQQPQRLDGKVLSGWCEHSSLLGWTGAKRGVIDSADPSRTVVVFWVVLNEWGSHEPEGLSGGRVVPVTWRLQRENGNLWPAALRKSLAFVTSRQHHGYEKG